VWKNTGAIEEGHVTGLEPATNYPNFKTFERQQGRVRTLPPGGRWEARLAVEVFDSAAGVAGDLRLQRRCRRAILGSCCRRTKRTTARPHSRSLDTPLRASSAIGSTSPQCKPTKVKIGSRAG